MAPKKNKVRRVIIGNSHAGLSALEKIHTINPETVTTIIGEERGFPYSPTSLPALIAGEIAEEKLRKSIDYERAPCNSGPEKMHLWTDMRRRYLGKIAPSCMF